MVKTLVFHTSNVGSIPPSLSIRSLQHLNLVNYPPRLAINQTNVIRYSFRFTSLVSPTTKYLTFDDPYSSSDRLPKRLLLKKSYILLSWVSYLSKLGFQKRKHFNPSIAILPSRQKKYTLTKAPMAHKTNSKEQFLFKFYNFKFSFELRPYVGSIPQTSFQGAYVFILTRSLFPTFETNLLSLKYYEVSYPIRITHLLTSTSLL